MLLFDGAAFSASPNQYDKSCLQDVLVMTDIYAEGAQEKIEAFMLARLKRPPMDDAEMVRVSTISLKSSKESAK